MKIFATLPGDAQKALARRELKRRGLLAGPQHDVSWLRFLTVAQLERLVLLCEQHERVPIDELPAAARAELDVLIRAALDAITSGAACSPPMDDAARAALAQRLQQQLDVPLVS